MADIKVNCVSIRCDQTPGYGMEVTCENVIQEDMKVMSIDEYETLLDDRNGLRVMLNETEDRLHKEQEANERLKQKVKNLREKLSARDT